jgi:hypothetical protein
VLAVVAAQVALPLSMLVHRWAEEGTRATTERPASWQMYSSVQPPRYRGIDRGGASRPLDVAPLPLLVREVTVGRTVPDRLCARHPDVVAVVREAGTDPGTFRC